MVGGVCRGLGLCSNAARCRVLPLRGAGCSEGLGATASSAFALPLQPCPKAPPATRTSNLSPICASSSRRRGDAEASTRRCPSRAGRCSSSMARVAAARRLHRPPPLLLLLQLRRAVALSGAGRCWAAGSSRARDACIHPQVLESVGRMCSGLVGRRQRRRRRRRRRRAAATEIGDWLGRCRRHDRSCCSAEHQLGILQAGCAKREPQAGPVPTPTHPRALQHLSLCTRKRSWAENDGATSDGPQGAAIGTMPWPC